MAQDYYNQKWVPWAGKIVGLKDIIAITIYQATFYAQPKSGVSCRWILHEEQHKRQWRIFMDDYSKNFEDNYGLDGGKIIEWVGIIEYVFRYNWKSWSLAYRFWRQGRGFVESLNLGYRNNPYEIEARAAEKGALR